MWFMFVKYIEISIVRRDYMLFKNEKKIHHKNISNLIFPLGVELLADSHVLCLVELYSNFYE